MADAVNAGAKIPHSALRKVVSQAKLLATEAGYQAVHDAMQIIGGIAYTDVYPIERLFRDARLSTIWTGSTEVMKMIIQNEIFREVLAEPKNLKRNIELDTPGAHKTEEKVYRGDIALKELKNLPYQSAKEELMSLPGVGHKVADCMLLFSLDKLEAFPVDRWIHRAVQEYYFQGKQVSDREIRSFAERYFGRYAGYAQQYLFYYMISS